MNTTTNALSVTVDDVLSWKPCWHEDRIREVMASKERWTAQDFADLYRSGRLSADEFLWVVLREELISEDVLHSLACDFAEAALMRERAAGREPHPELWKAIEVARKLAQGDATNKELLEAREAARAAAWKITKSATQAEKLSADAALSATAESARSAAWNAAWAGRHATWSSEESAKFTTWALTVTKQAHHVIETL